MVDSAAPPDLLSAVLGYTDEAGAHDAAVHEVVHKVPSAAETATEAAALGMVAIPVTHERTKIDAAGGPADADASMDARSPARARADPAGSRAADVAEERLLAAAEPEENHLGLHAFDHIVQQLQEGTFPDPDQFRVHAAPVAMPGPLSGSALMQVLEAGVISLNADNALDMHAHLADAAVDSPQPQLQQQQPVAAVVTGAPGRGKKKARRGKPPADPSVWRRYGVLKTHRNKWNLPMCQCETPRQASFGPRSGNSADARWCRHCLPGEDLDAGHLACLIQGCVCGRAHASFAGADGKRRYCSECRLTASEPVRDVVSKRCECGRAVPSFGPVNGLRKSARWCSRCRVNAGCATVDVTHARCACGASQPTFGPIGGAPSDARWCKLCRSRAQDETEDVKNAARGARKRRRSTTAPVRTPAPVAAAEVCAPQIAIGNAEAASALGLGAAPVDDAGELLQLVEAASRAD